MHHSAYTLIALALALATTTGAAAQYDRDGRYVPSPMGVPRDPTARPVPMYPGSPGKAIGTPVWPRDPPLKEQPVGGARRYDPPIASPLPIPLSREQCEAGWSVGTNVPRVEFNRRCARMRPKPPPETDR